MEVFNTPNLLAAVEQTLPTGLSLFVPEETPKGSREIIRLVDLVRFTTYTDAGALYKICEDLGLETFKTDQHKTRSRKGYRTIKTEDVGALLEEVKRRKHLNFDEMVIALAEAIKISSFKINNLQPIGKHPDWINLLDVMRLIDKSAERTTHFSEKCVASGIDVKPFCISQSNYHRVLGVRITDIPKVLELMKGWVNR